MNDHVYLAGPIEGLTHEQMSGWRNQVKDDRRLKYRVLDPCDREAFHSQVGDQVQLAKRIVFLDELDIRRSRVILMNLSQMNELGLRCWGSICELTYAYHLGIPVVLVLPKPTDHPFILTYATEIHYDLPSAIDATAAYFRE
jgi:nucleoside 2-deoxyribosyltransferase